jgi:hypothetical protein
MSDKPRPWPNMAKESRDRSAEEACRGLRALLPMLENSFTREEEVRRIAIAISCLQTIARLLEAVGAQTRP